MSDAEILRRALAGENRVDGSTFRVLVAEVRRLRAELEDRGVLPWGATCSGCGETLPECRCDEWAEHDARAMEPGIPCSCPYCFCHDSVETEGEACSSCINGAHQG